MAQTKPTFSGEIEQSAWTTFTPNWTASSSAPAIGNGTFTGAYQQIGKTVNIRLNFVGGSTTTWGSGTYYINFPVAPIAAIGAANIGFNLAGYAEDTGAVAYVVVGARVDSSTRFRVNIFAPQSATVLQWSHNQPFTWSTGDYWSATGMYEAA